jgi:hypothetical protein
VFDAGTCVESPDNTIYGNVISRKNCSCTSQRAHNINFFSREFQKRSSKEGGQNSEAKRTEEEFNIRPSRDKYFLAYVAQIIILRLCPINT